MAYIARKSEDELCIWNFIGIPGNEETVEDLGLDGRIILKCTLKKKVVKMWMGFNWFRMGSNGKLL